jgi:tetratricopeptide (TPR) repeat protein
VFINFFFSCSKQAGDIQEVFTKVENMLEQQPDSALRLLHSIFFSEELNKKSFNKYNLLLIQAKDKCNKDITADTVIFAVKDYYVQQENYPNAALAAFYCGRVLHEQKNAEKAATTYLEAKKLAEYTDNHNLKGLIYGNLGILYQEYFLNKEQAMAMSKNAVEMYDKALNYKNKISALCTIGNCFLIENKMDSAFYYYNQSLSLADSVKITDMQSVVRQSIGVAYCQKGDYEKSKEFFNEAFSFSSDTVEYAKIYFSLAKVFICENQIDLAKFYLKQFLNWQIQNPWLIGSYYCLLSEIEEKENHYSKAMEYYKEYFSHSMKVLDNKENNKLLEIQEKYDFEKLKNSKNKEIIEQQKIVTILSIGLLVLCVIAFLFYKKSLRKEALLLDAEQKYNSLQKMADDFSSVKKNSIKHLLLEHFEIVKKTTLINQYLTENEQKSGQKLLMKFNKIVYGQDTLDWEKLYHLMNELKDGFYDKIREKYPKLTELEFRVCCLTCETDFVDTEISIFIGKSVDMVRKIRSGIREKIGMTSYDQKIYSFLKGILLKKDE